MKVLLVVGHTGVDKGAYSKYLEKSEYDYNKELALEIMKLDGEDGIHYDMYEHSIRNYYNRQRKLAEYANKKKYDLILELHFNGATPSANGTECLHYFSSEKGKMYSKQISNSISKHYGTTIRGVEGSKAVVNKFDRGYWFVRLLKAVAVIVEPFFGSNKESLQFKDTKEYACVLHESISKLKK